MVTSLTLIVRLNRPLCCFRFLLGFIDGRTACGFYLPYRVICGWRRPSPHGLAGLLWNRDSTPYRGVFLPIENDEFEAV